MDYAWPDREIAVMGGCRCSKLSAPAKLKNRMEILPKPEKAEYTKLFANPYNALKYSLH